MSKWIAVDFDGTLATSVTQEWDGPLGEPIPAMVERVKQWLADGIEVRIFTARAFSYDRDYKPIPLHEHNRVMDRISDWCERYLGERLPITCRKDHNVEEIWDDRAVQVVKDTGERVGNVNRGGE